jgi:hypothetical protein
MTRAALSVWMCLAISAASSALCGVRLASANGEWLCAAQGTYSNCYGIGDGLKQCVDQAVSGMGAAPTEAAARVMAEINCEQHKTSMIIIANIGDGGANKAPCVATACQRADAALAPPPAPAADACDRAVRGLCSVCGDASALCVQGRATAPTTPLAQCQALLDDLGVGAEVLRASGDLTRWCAGDTPQAPQPCRDVASYLCGTCGVQSYACKQGLEAIHSPVATCEESLRALQAGVPQLAASGQLQPWCAGQLR